MRPFAISDRYLALAPEPRLQILRREASWLEAELESDPLPLIPGHIDPNPTNFLRLDDGTLRLIDWEFSAMVHPCWDLAAIALDTGLDQAETDYLLGAAGYAVDARMRRRVALFATALGLVASSWAFVEIAAGNDAPDLHAFAEQRLDAFSAGLHRLAVQR
jgi:thiamine kinase-like enzyme